MTLHRMGNSSSSKADECLSNDLQEQPQSHIIIFIVSVYISLRNEGIIAI